MTASDEHSRPQGQWAAQQPDPHSPQPANGQQPMTPEAYQAQQEYLAQQQLYAAQQAAAQQHAAQGQPQAQPQGHPSQQYAQQQSAPVPQYQATPQPHQQETDLYGQPGGYHYPQATTEAQPAAEAAPVSDLSSLSNGRPYGASQQAPQFDAYQPPQQQAAAMPQQSQQFEVPAAQPAAQSPQYQPAAQQGADQHFVEPAFQPAPEPDFNVPPTAPPAFESAPPAFESAPPAFEPAPQAYEAPPQGYDAAPPAYKPAEPYGYDVGAAYAPPPAGDANGQAWAEPQQPYVDPSLDPYGSPQMAPDNGGLEAVGHNQDIDSQYADDYDEEFYDEPPRGRRSMVVLGALIGAIAVGGGLAYGYKSFLGPGPSNGATKVVRGQASPTKVKPAAPGGKEFAHANSKVLGRLADTGAKATRSKDGTRRVQTVTVGRDGRVGGGQAKVAAGAAAASSAGAGTAAAEDPSDFNLPGVSVVDAFAGSRQSANAAAAPARRTVKTVAVRPTTAAAVNKARAAAKPIVISQAKTTRAAVRQSNTAPAGLGGAAVKPRVIAKKPVQPKTQVAKVVPRRPSTGGSATRNGYVAVLASVPVSKSSRVKALTQFANLRKRYGSVLSSKTPDVVEANLGAKGTYHRLLVGPPGSRSAANRVCAQLKTAGYSGCWVTAY